MVLLNTQPVEKPSYRDDGALEVVNVWLTMQGEGPFAGYPAVFIRTAGCNLSSTCKLCDTDYTSGRRLQTPTELLERVVNARGGNSKKITLVVITGGEPFRQACGPLVQALLAADFTVQFETNGTLFDPSMEGHYSSVSVVCSPKSAKINERLLPEIDAYKYVLSADAVDPTDGLPTSALGSPAPPARPHPGFAGRTYVQPCDNQDPVCNAANLKVAKASCMRHGYILSLQLHKLLGLE